MSTSAGTSTQSNHRRRARCRRRLASAGQRSAPRTASAGRQGEKLVRSQFHLVPYATPLEPGIMEQVVDVREASRHGAPSRAAPACRTARRPPASIRRGSTVATVGRARTPRGSRVSAQTASRRANGPAWSRSPRIQFLPIGSFIFRPHRSCFQNESSPSRRSTSADHGVTARAQQFDDHNPAIHRRQWLRPHGCVRPLVRTSYIQRVST